MASDVKYKVDAGFFDAIDEDRTYSADDMNRPYRKLISNGVFATPAGTPSDFLQVFAADNEMNVIVSAGYALIGDKWFENPSDLMITISQNSEILPRIDSIVAQVDKTQTGRVGNIVYRQGQASSNPVHPNINTEEEIAEFRLADIRISPSCVEITQNLITDCRGSSECPWVTSLIKQVDTSTLYAQWQAAYKKYYDDQEIEHDNYFNEFKDSMTNFFNEEETAFISWFNEVKGHLSEDVAGNLYNLLENKASKQELELELNKLKKKAGKIYGIRRNLETSSTEWERIEDAVGLTAVAAQNETATLKNDFDNIYPWSDIISYNYDVQGERITAYYREPTFKFDGSNGEVMTRIPEFWCKREQKDGYEYIYIADYEAEGFIKIEQFSIGRYISSGNIERLHSQSDVDILVNIAPENIRNSIKSIGKGWLSLDIFHWSILQLLYLVEYADYNAQSKLGKGCSTGDAIARCGGTNNLGMKSGCILPDNGMTQVIYRGVEDIFGNILQFCDGINILNTGVIGLIAYISYDSTKYECDTNFENTVSIELPLSSGYITKIGYDEKNPLIQLPIKVGGSSDTYISDNYAAPTTGDEVYTVVWIGGCATHNQQAGLWYYSCNFISSYTNKYRGCRLLLNK